MKFPFTALPNWNTPGEGGGSAAPPGTESAPASPPAPAPASSGEPSAPTAIPAPEGVREVAPQLDETTSFALEAFEQMNRDDIDLPDDVIEVDATSQVPPGVSPPPAAPVPSPPAQPGTTPPVQAAVTEGQQPPPQAAPSAPAPVAPVPSTQPQAPVGFGQIAEELTKQQEQFVNALAETNYKLSEKDLEEFATDPGKVIQRIAATVQVSTTASVMKVFAQQLPVVVNGLIQARQRNQEAEDSFWKANPALDRAKHRELAGKVMQNVRSLDPNMDSQQFIRTVGGIVAGLAGVQAAAPSAAPAPVVRTPGPVVRATNGAGAFAPVGANAAPPSAHPAPQKNEWETLADLMMADDGGAFDS